MPRVALGSAAIVPVVPPRGCYRVQVLVAARQKRWRDAVSAQIRRTGCQVTTCDNGVDAMAVLALGLPLDVMVVDASLEGRLCCSRLAQEARALRPSLRVVLACDMTEAEREAVELPDALIVAKDHRAGAVASKVREALAVPALAT
ncbi:histidine kinase [Methylobacterium radiodurans]|uniref:Histidine kinase n=1 Tax=Methylobacterium radiodurans TaxID=2202828 RepID=A0A2U8VNB8_9HYPH|nr:histidine kinase [Methylobacterium radiodurans]AWN34931.1 histidine kinase [Methylobacterium radiodurans]